VLEVSLRLRQPVVRPVRHARQVTCRWKGSPPFRPPSSSCGLTVV